MTAPRSERVETTRGVRLNVVRAGAGRPVVVLHGFTGSADSMASVVEGEAGLARRFETVCVELIGHGESDAPEDVALYTMESCMEQVLAALERLDCVRPHLLGYSMGGRVALSLCARSPGRFASALLIGVSPGMTDAAQRRERIAADDALARRIGEEGLEAFVDHWMALPLFASQKRLGESGLARARADRLRRSPRGLAASLRGMGTGAMPPLQARLPGIDLPIALVVGEEDAKFRGIAAGLEAVLPDARTHCIAQAGHAVHLEQPAAFLPLAADFFDGVDRRIRRAGAER